jgi:hypothetical protein
MLEMPEVDRDKAGFMIGQMKRRSQRELRFDF